MFNNLRVDDRAQLIDQESLGLFLRTTGEGSTGVLIHHGNWDERSWEASSGLWRAFEESGVGKYYLSHPADGRRSGSLEDLPKGNAGALENVLKALRSRKRSSSA